jgi:hypothetical protein
MKTIFSGIAVCTIAGLACLLAGCGPSGSVKAAAQPTRVDASLIERCASLYLSPAGPQKIIVEIDSVEGCEPPQAALDELGEFLHRYTSKEVRYLRKPSIARSDSVGMPPEVLATRNARGASADGNDAYLYLLFYEGESNSKLAAYVPPYYRCAILVKMSCRNAAAMKMWGLVEALSRDLKHEAGHVLGLCRNLSHGDGIHCRNACLMQERAIMVVSISKWVLGSDYITKPPTDLCADCRQDLTHIKERQKPSGMEFNGPILVRHEQQYTVYILPCHLHIEFGGAKLERDDLIAIALNQAKAILTNKATYTFSYSWDDAHPSSQLSSVEAAQKDGNMVVRSAAKEVERVIRRKSIISRSATEPSPSGASTTRGQLDTGTANEPAMGIK